MGALRMTFLGYACLFVFMLSASTVANMLSYKRGYRDGVKDGQADRQEQDRRHEAGWWIEAEKGIDGARQQIWREEETKGEWL